MADLRHGGLACLRCVWHLPRNVLILLVKLYRVTLSPVIGRQCKFIPTCSQYAIDALNARGAVVGLVLTIWRLLRCSPLTKGGYDPAPVSRKVEKR